MPILDPDVEALITEHALDMQQRFHGLTLTDIRRMAFAIAASKGVAHPFDKNKGIAGLHWLKGFLDRSTGSSESGGLC